MLGRFSIPMTAAIAFATVIGSTQAQTVVVNSDIAVSTTWVNTNTYDLQSQIFVLPGASLTIQAGTVIASTPTANGAGSLAVANGGQIFVQGTECNPVIMTSLNDVATWAADGSHPTGGDPTTGTWREAANEWGNLTIMGSGYISEDEVLTNTATCDPNNTAPMEGLTTGPRFYGGGNDDDDSGSISYLSIRYGGRVVGLANELNGLSLGGVGRETDIDHVEIMNNVDDGVEIWGGTVNLKYLSVWNIGDDSIDIDQGYRGRIQFGLIVQGYSLCNGDQGGGVGDNCFETDGAEDSDYQPVTTTVIHNVTVIGQPSDGDGGTTWRDGARVQYRNCIFMDLGDQLVRFDNDDGDGASGYGHNGTLSWADVWTTDWNAVPAHANDCSPREDFYKAQYAGKLASITDSVFFRNLNGSAYTEATARGVFAASNNNELIAGSLDADAPIQSITRGAPVDCSINLGQLPVVGLDPRPANEALTSVEGSPWDGFFTDARYRGGFVPGQSWLTGWTASDAFGFTGTGDRSVDLGGACSGGNGDMNASITGDIFSPGGGVVSCTNINTGAAAAVLFGGNRLDFPLLGCVLVPLPIAGPPISPNAQGEFSYTVSNWPTAQYYVQFAQIDFSAQTGQGLTLSNAVCAK